ncbi:hypothetical protein QQA02_10160 [Corynebacterium sp. MSK006]|uniref:hypothetical protein n=1 Tax=Corynebacterium TaxID=1716 RepID=UPI00254A30AA|nr:MULTISPECIES: hypothetical protein [Corynebacterium]MDK8896045.1 hypothetical protein [Corynebacterium sp. MSK006]
MTPAPVPHDPTATRVRPEAVRAGVGNLLRRAEGADSADAEAAHLEEAHALLQAALKDQPLSGAEEEAHARP